MDYFQPYVSIPHFNNEQRETILLKQGLCFITSRISVTVKEFLFLSLQRIKHINQEINKQYNKVHTLL